MRDCIRKAMTTLEGHLAYDQKCELIDQRIDEVIRDEDGRSTLAELLVDPFMEKTEKVAIAHMEYMDLYEALWNCSKRHRSLLKYHYGFIDGEEHRMEETAYHFRKSVSKMKMEHEDALWDIRENFSMYPRYKLLPAVSGL